MVLLTLILPFKSLFFQP